MPAQRRTDKPQPEPLIAPRQRELLIIRHGIAEPEWLATGVTTDTGIMDMYGHVCGQESDAWVLLQLGLLPEWWELVDQVEVRNLTRFPDTTDNPEEDAQLRLDGLSRHDLAMLRTGWRVMHTSGGGRIYRVRDRTPIVRDIEALLIQIDKVDPKVMGPFEENMATAA